MVTVAGNGRQRTERIDPSCALRNTIAEIEHSRADERQPGLDACLDEDG
jgi:hypothetical protein